MAGGRHARLAATLAVLCSALSAGQAGVPCALETLPGARAACLGAEADRLLTVMDLRLAGFGADAYTAGAATLAAFAGALARVQSDWRAGMEAACRAASDPPACRLAAAEARAARIDAVLAETLARHGIAPPPGPPACAVLLDLDHPRARGHPRIECDLTPLVGPP